jgi:hypothetical protein
MVTVQVTNQDLRQPLPLTVPQSFQLITGTPPYIPPGAGGQSNKPQKGPCCVEIRGENTAYEAAAAVLGGCIDACACCSVKHIRIGHVLQEPAFVTAFMSVWQCFELDNCRGAITASWCCFCCYTVPLSKGSLQRSCVSALEHLASFYLCVCAGGRDMLQEPALWKPFQVLVSSKITLLLWLLLLLLLRRRNRGLLSSSSSSPGARRPLCGVLWPARPTIQGTACAAGSSSGRACYNTSSDCCNKGGQAATVCCVRHAACC